MVPLHGVVDCLLDYFYASTSRFVPVSPVCRLYNVYLLHVSLLLLASTLSLFYTFYSAFYNFWLDVVLAYGMPLRLSRNRFSSVKVDAVYRLWFAERTRMNLCTLDLDWFYTAAKWNILCGMARKSCCILWKLLKRLIYVYHYTKKTFLQWGAIISENCTNDCVNTHPWNCLCHENMPIWAVGMQHILSGYLVIQSTDVSYLHSSGFKNRDFACGGDSYSAFRYFWLQL